ncbi:hypothetical protein TCON_2318 [Astathelohania contejeani]|uniref:Uncharacterized protein n=1 Tax=Astathelohania contejeani TaxID=164912 RepID=A0ABQ7HWE3_9MICR|nr:hypothetical protein TCON_2318 [Thelohania contejeani]
MKSFYNIIYQISNIIYNFINKNDIEYMETVLLNIKVSENYEFVVSDEKLKFENIVKNVSKHSKIQLYSYEKKWILMLYEILSTAKYQDPSSVYDLFEFIGSNLYLLASIDDYNFLSKLNKKILVLFNRLIINKNRVICNDQIDINENFYEQLISSFRNMNDDSFDANLENINPVFNKDIFVLLISVFYYTGSYRTSNIHLKHELLKKYIFFLFKINLNESIKLLVLQKILYNNTVDFLLIEINGLKNENNLLSFSILELMVNKKLYDIDVKAIRNMVLIKHNIIPNECKYIENVIIFYFFYEDLKPHIRKYFNKNESELFDFFINLFVCNDEINDKNNFRYRMIESLTFLNNSESILTFINRYISSISIGITSICDISQKESSINFQYYHDLFETLLTMINRYYFFECFKEHLAKDQIISKYNCIVKDIFPNYPKLINNQMVYTLFIGSWNDNTYFIRYKEFYLYIITIILFSENLFEKLNNIKSEFVNNTDIYNSIVKVMSIPILLRFIIKKYKLYLFKEIYTIDHYIIQCCEKYIHDNNCYHCFDHYDIIMLNCLDDYKKELESGLTRKVISVNDFLEGKKFELFNE